MTQDRTITLADVEYTVVYRTTGGDYVFLQDFATEEVEEEIKASDAEKAEAEADGRELTPVKVKVRKVVSSRYDLATLIIRLRLSGRKLTETEIRALPRPVYFTLVTIATELDNLEAGESSDFLSLYLAKHPELQSALANFSASPLNTSEPTSTSE